MAYCETSYEDEIHIPINAIVSAYVNYWFYEDNQSTCDSSLKCRKYQCYIDECEIYP